MQDFVFIDTTSPPCRGGVASLIAAALPLTSAWGADTIMQVAQAIAEHYGAPAPRHRPVRDGVCALPGRTQRTCPPGAELGAGSASPINRLCVDRCPAERFHQRPPASRRRV